MIGLFKSGLLAEDLNDLSLNEFQFIDASVKKNLFRPKVDKERDSEVNGVTVYYR